MRKLLLLLSFLLLSIPAHAQGGLRWLADSAVVHQVGCTYGPDSLIVSFTNVSNKPILLDTINGPTKNWEVASPLAYAHSVIQAGAVKQVKIYLRVPNRFRNEKLILCYSDSLRDTLRLLEDLQVSRLVSTMRDTVRYDSHIPLDGVKAWYPAILSAVGTIPFVISSITFTGDTTIKPSILASDTVIPGTQGLSITYTHYPIAYGSDTLVTTVRGTPCDSVLTYVLIITTIEPAASRVKWYYPYVGMPSVCGQLRTFSEPLINSTEISHSIDSIRIVGDSLFNLVSTSPPNRLDNFVMASGDTIQYAIIFGGQPDLSQHTAYLISYGAGSLNDTARLTGSFLKSGLTTPISDYDLGERYVGEIWEVFTGINYTGNRAFVISDIEAEGALTLTYEGIEIGKEVNGNKLLYFSASSTLPGMQEGSITILGAECDTVERITFRGNFSELLSVGEETLENNQLFFDGRYLRDLRADIPDPIKIYDITGREIAHSTQREIDLSWIPTGTYIAVTDSGRKLKFVK
jgi:hypothetical protein